MSKEARAIINLIESQREKARHIYSRENTMELAYLKALVTINDLNYSEEVADYVIQLFDIRLKEQYKFTC